MIRCIVTVLLMLSVRSMAAELVVDLPEGMVASTAIAMARELKLDVTATIDRQHLTFKNLLPQVAYDLRITLTNDTVLRGADMAWYSLEEAPSEAAAMTDDDRRQIEDIVTKVPAFYDRSEILILRADHHRGVALVQLIREKAFHASHGDAIWRVELWYFKNQAGGWEKINQQNKVLDRQRFTRPEDLAAAKRIKWLPELGGIRFERSDDQIKLTVRKPE